MRVFGEYDIRKQEIIGGQLLQIVPFTEKRSANVVKKTWEIVIGRSKISRRFV